jgi:hypothetical protein
MVSAVGQRARGGAQLLGPVGALTAAAYLANPYFKWFNATPQPVWAGIAAIGFVYAAYVTATGKYAIWNSVRGEDGRASTSKFQVFLWTGAVLFAYVAVLAVRWKAGQTDTLPDIPEGVLAALGISSGTAVAAQAITANAVGSGSTVKPPLARNRGLAPIFQNDADQPDIGKIQLIAWTFIAVGVFLAGALRIVSAGSTDASLPDIDPTLMVLTGLGSATYLGRKLVTTTTPTIASVSLSFLSLVDSEPRLITIQGANFGATQGGSQVLIDGTALQERPESWSDSEITFAVPITKPNGTAWKLDTPVPVTVNVGGVQSQGTILLTLRGT